VLTGARAPASVYSCSLDVSERASERQQSRDAGPAEPARLSLWRHGDFLKLWGGETLSQIGVQITVLALPLTAIITLDASPEEVGLLTAAQFAPFLFLTLFVGVWLDSHRRRPALLVANLGRFVLFGLIPLLHALDHLSMGVLYAVAFLAGALTVLFDVGYLVYLPSLVAKDDLVEANSKLESTYSIAQIGGPGLGGVLVQALTAPFAILVNAITYAIGFVTVASIRTPEPEPAPSAGRTSMLAEIKVGLETTFRHRLLLPLVLQSGWVNLFKQATLTLMLLYAVRELDLASGLVGVILMTQGVGALGGTFVARRIGDRIGIGPTLVGTIGLATVGLALVPAASGPELSAFAFLAGGFLIYGFNLAVFNIHSLSLRMAIVPAALLARVMATFRVVLFGTIPLGGLLAGFLGSAIGLRPALVVAAIALVASSFVFALTRVRSVGAIETVTPIPEPAS
jgi:MFS family permease